MKKRRSFRPAWVLLTAVIPLLGCIGRAQLPEGAAGGMNAALTQLFGRATFFSAKVDVVVLDPAQQELLRMPMNFAALEGKIRLEIDVSQIRSKHVTPEIISAMNQAGIGKMATIIRPDKKASYILYPVLRNYSVVPMSKAEADAIGKPLNTERTELGKETIDGHSCVKRLWSAAVSAEDQPQKGGDGREPRRIVSRRSDDVWGAATGATHTVAVRKAVREQLATCNPQRVRITLTSAWPVFD
jgi:hypothetical protein